MISPVACAMPRLIALACPESGSEAQLTSLGA